MGNPVDETRDSDAQPIGDEEPTHHERADEANAPEGKPAGAAALEADDDEYEMVDPSELVDVLKEEVLEAAEKAPAVVTEEPPTTVPEEIPLRRTITSLSSPPRATISSASLLTMSGTVPPVPRPSKDRSGGRERALSTKRAAAAAAITAALTAAFFGAKHGAAPTSAPSREVAAAIPAAPESQAQPKAVAADPIAAAAAVPTPETPEPTHSPSPAATEHLSKLTKESPPAENHKDALPSASDRAELAAIALKVGASKAAARICLPARVTFCRAWPQAVQSRRCCSSSRLRGRSSSPSQ